MPERNDNSPATVPEQPEAKPPLRKTMPVVVALVVIMALIGIANLSSLMRGNKRGASAANLPVSRPAAPSAQQVNNFETQQQLQAERDAQERQHAEEMAAAMQQLGASDGVPGPEASGTPPMTAAQRAAIYGDSPNAPLITSGASEQRAEAKQQELAKEKQALAAIDSDTEAIDFESPNTGSTLTAAAKAQPPAAPVANGAIPDKTANVQAVPQQEKPDDNGNPMAPYAFDSYQGQLYRIFEGTVLEGVVTNHIDGGFSGPVLVMLTTDYYSHDHQQLLMPQGTRLIGTVQTVGSAQQRKMFVTFHRAICPDGFSLDFDKYIGLDQIGTTGLATKVNHGYFQAFAAAALIGGLGGLAQIGNNGSILTPSTEIQNGISEESAVEGEQVLNHFLDRLPVITLKEGSRARIYVGRDILVPSYAEHRVDPTL